MIIGCTSNISLLSTSIIQAFNEKIFITHPSPKSRKQLINKLCEFKSGIYPFI